MSLEREAVWVAQSSLTHFLLEVKLPTEKQKLKLNNALFYLSGSELVVGGKPALSKG